MPVKIKRTESQRLQIAQDKAIKAMKKAMEKAMEKAEKEIKKKFAQAIKSSEKKVKLVVKNLKKVTKKTSGGGAACSSGVTPPLKDKEIIERIVSFASTTYPEVYRLYFLAIDVTDKPIDSKWKTLTGLLTNIFYDVFLYIYRDPTSTQKKQILDIFKTICENISDGRQSFETEETALYEIIGYISSNLYKFRCSLSHNFEKESGGVDLWKGND